MGLFEQSITKEEKDAMLTNIEQLKTFTSKLQSSTSDQLQTLISGLKPLIESHLTVGEKDILEIQNKVQQCLDVLEQSSDSVSKAKLDVDKNKKHIDDQVIEVNKNLDSSNANSLQISIHLQKAKEELDLIVGKKNELDKAVADIEQLAAKSEISQTKIESFEQAIESVEDSKNKISLTQKNMRDLLLEVKALHTDIFGGEEKNEETGAVTKIEGLVSKLKLAYSKIESDMGELRKETDVFKNEKNEEFVQLNAKWDAEFIELKNKIEGLLPGALSAGLSQAYEEKKKAEILEIESAGKTFQKSIWCLTGISSIPVGIYLYLLVFSGKHIEEALSLAPNVFLTILPIYVPCLWVAFSADKKTKLSKRLAEEYAHKASISKTFEGISRQVGNLRDNKLSSELEAKLLFNLIQVSSENPGKLISDYNKTDHPLYEALDKGLAYSETLEKLAFIPGIDKILAGVQRRARKKVEELAAELDEDTKSSNTKSEVDNKNEK